MPSHVYTQPSFQRPIVLASGSPRRIAMLQSLGLFFVSRPQSIDESAYTVEDPQSYVLRLAAAKAQSALQSHQKSTSRPSLKNPVFLGADTVVVFEGTLLGKPSTRQEAQKTLSSLSGHRHQVITGYWIEDLEGDNHHGTVETDVAFRKLFPKEIEDYLETREWTDKAGGYGIQGSAAFMVEAIYGSYSNVVGLPLAEITRDLREMGALDRLFGSPSHHELR